MFAVKSRYPEHVVTPMREELTNLGVEELRTATEVEEALSEGSGIVLVIINSVCGCAAGSARPAVRLAMKHDVLPDRVTTVFAGVDHEAVDRARSNILGYPPSSPSMALFRDGQLLYMMPRYEIEGKYPEEIADALKQKFDEHCR
jgi:putative YphP/YqiW family bacilliredoxin